MKKILIEFLLGIDSTLPPSRMFLQKSNQNSVNFNFMQLTTLVGEKLLCADLA
jgi:hypothetical protein